MELRDELRELLHKVCASLATHPDDLNVRDVAALIGAFAQLEGTKGNAPQTIEVVMSEEVEAWAR